MSTIQKCPMCAEEIPLTAETCEYCGAPFIVTSSGYCQTCHALRDADEDGHCRVCDSLVADWRLKSTLREEPVTHPEPIPLSQSQPAPPVPVQPQFPTTTAGESTELVVLPIRGEGVNLRFSALFLDVIFISIFYAMVTVLIILPGQGVAGLGRFDSVAGLADFQDIVALWLIPLVWFLYFTVFEGAFGATPGKALSYLRVIRKGGGRIAWWQAAVRALVGLVEVNPIGAIVIWSTPLKQRIGDLLAGTLVVHKEKIHKVEMRPPALNIEFHNYRRVEFARITGGIVSKFGQIRNLALNGFSPQGEHIKLNLKGHFFRSEFNMLRRNIEHRYEVTFPEKIILWRLAMVLVLPILIVAGLIFGFTLYGHETGSQDLPALFETKAPPTFTPIPATETPEATATLRPTPTVTPPPVEISFDTIGDMPVGQDVILVGRLAMFGSTYCTETYCGLLLENPAKTSQKVTIFVTLGSENNQMKPLPDPYTKADIQVRLDDGTLALIGYRIRVTGSVCKTTADEPCIGDITKIELFQVQ